MTTIGIGRGRDESGEDYLARCLVDEGIVFQRQYPIDPHRMWRADFAFPAAGLLVEVEGGTWSGGRHVRGAGFAEDVRKYNRAQLNGFRLLRFTTEMVDADEAIPVIREALGLAGLPQVKRLKLRRGRSR